MPKMISFYNSKKHAVHIGSKTIMPGDTREIEETLHPNYKPPASIVDIPLTFIDKASDMNANDLIKSLTDITDEELNEVAYMEAKGKNRKTVNEAIANEQILRTKSDDVQRTMDNYKLQFSEMDNEELSSQQDVYKDQPDLLELVKQEIKDRG